MGELGGFKFGARVVGEERGRIWRLESLDLLNAVLWFYQCQTASSSRASGTLWNIKLRFLLLTRNDLILFWLRHIWFFFHQGQTLSERGNWPIIQRFDFQWINFRIDLATVKLLFYKRLLVWRILQNFFLEINCLFKRRIEINFLRAKFFVVKLLFFFR